MTDASSPLLEIANLDISFASGKSTAHAVRGLNLDIRAREIHALVGESGSGKSVTSKAILGLLPRPPARVDSGRILWKGTDLLTLSREQLRRIRGSEIAMVFQEPGKHLNPALKIDRQITEILIEHRGMSAAEARTRAVALMDMVELANPGSVLGSYPHELSGGMKQRALIAMAISCSPELLLADEPTTALDATVQGQILKLLRKLRSELDMAVLLVSHDLGVVQSVADRVSVIYTGKIFETAVASSVFERPLHPYTNLLIGAIPEAAKRGQRLVSIPGRVPDARSVPGGCSFHPRCPLAAEVCSRVEPPLVPHETEHPAACHFAGRHLTPEPAHG